MQKSNWTGGDGKRIFLSPMLLLFLFVFSSLSYQCMKRIKLPKRRRIRAYTGDRENTRVATIGFARARCFFPVAVFHIFRVSSRPCNCFNLSRLSRVTAAFAKTSPSGNRRGYGHRRGELRARPFPGTTRDSQVTTLCKGTARF